MLGLYSFSPLTPGGWVDLLSELGLPATLRRLSQTVAIGGRVRSVEMRCLAALPGLAYLLTDRDGPSSASVRAWRLAARVVEGAVLGGGTVPDLSRFAAAFPEAGYAVVEDGDGEEPVSLAPEAAVEGFVDASMRALAAAVRDPKLLRSGEVQLSGVDLARAAAAAARRRPRPGHGRAGGAPARLARAAPAAARAARRGRGRLAASGDAGRSRPPAAGGTRVRAARPGGRRRRHPGRGRRRRAAPGDLGARVRRRARGAAAGGVGGARPRLRRRPPRARGRRAPARRRRPLRPEGVARRPRDQRRGAARARGRDPAAGAAGRRVAGAQPQGARPRPRARRLGAAQPRHAGDDRPRRGARRIDRRARAW